MRKYFAYGEEIGTKVMKYVILQVILISLLYLIYLPKWKNDEITEKRKYLKRKKYKSKYIK